MSLLSVHFSFSIINKCPDFIFLKAPAPVGPGEMIQVVADKKSIKKPSFMFIVTVCP